MNTLERALSFWSRPGQSPSPALLELAALVRHLGGTRAMAHWQGAKGPGRVAYVNGERHDLWWEFTLAASFEWQGQLAGLHPEVYQSRVRQLARTLALEPLLNRPVAELTAAERVRANLAVALLPEPDCLLWEEPFALVDEADASRLSACIRSMVRAGKLTALVVQSQPKAGLLRQRRIPS